MCDEYGLTNRDAELEDVNSDALLYNNGHFLGSSPIGMYSKCTLPTFFFQVLACVCDISTFVYLNHFMFVRIRHYYIKYALRIFFLISVNCSNYRFKQITACYFCHVFYFFSLFDEISNSCLSFFFHSKT